MARTAAEALTSARVAMNDAAKRRFSDATGLGFLVDALNTVKNARPDLFVGSWGPIETMALVDPLPLSSQFFRPVVDFLIARAESIDEEASNQARAQLMAALGGGFLS